MRQCVDSDHRLNKPKSRLPVKVGQAAAHQKCNPDGSLLCHDFEAAKEGHNLVHVYPQLDLLIKGGLGNQLFQLAAVLELQQRHDLRVFVHTIYLPEKEDTFRHLSRWPLVPTWLPASIHLVNSRRQPPNSTSLTSKIFTSFFYARGVVNSVQRKWKFVKDSEVLALNFNDTRTRRYFLSGTFSFGDLILSQQEQMREIVVRSTANNSFPAVSEQDIAVHVRLGDRTPTDTKDFHKMTSYFKEALRLLDADNDSPIRIFSDNPSLARRLLIASNYTNLIEAPEGLDAISNLALMASHQNIIASASTYSWWASFLQVHGSTIYPESSLSNLQRRNLALRNHTFL